MDTLTMAEMSCALKVNVNCEICKRKLMEVLQNLHGVYSVAIDAENGTVKISARVNPNLILRILQNNGKHAEVISIQFDGEVVVDHFDYYSYYGENSYINNPRRIAHPYPFLMGPEYPYYGRGPHFLPPALPPPPLAPPPIPLAPPPLLRPCPHPPPPPPPPPSPPVSDSPSVPKEVAPPPSRKEPECNCNIM